MHTLSGALPLPYVPARVTSCALVAHGHSFAPPRCRTSQYHRTIVPLSLTLWNHLGDCVFDGEGWRVLRAEPIRSCWTNLLFLAVSYYFLLPCVGWFCGVGVFELIDCSHSLLTLHC